MQADSRLTGRGLKPQYSGPLDTLQKVVRKEGLVGLPLPKCSKSFFLVNVGELACYDHANRFIISSIVSGLSATALSCPADVIKTRMMNQGASCEEKVKYKDSFDCFAKTVRHEGLRALWKGFFPTWARLGPWQFVFWVSYEKFRHIAGISSF